MDLGLAQRRLSVAVFLLQRARSLEERRARVAQALEARAALGAAFDAWLDKDRPAALRWADTKVPDKRLAQVREASAPLQAAAGHPLGEILLVGITGVGKSTLANAVLGRPAAAVGIGAGVTRGVERHRSPDGLTTVVDTEGLELGGEVDHLVALARLADVVWYCVQAGSERFQPGESALVAALLEAGCVLVVLTQSLEPPSQLAATIKGHHDVPVVPILAADRALGPHTVAANGLDDLFAAHVRCYSR